MCSRYLQNLQPGEKVIETEKSSCMYGKKGVVYQEIDFEEHVVCCDQNTNS